MAKIPVFILTFQILFTCLIYAVDRNNFKTCEQSGFCRRCRNSPREDYSFVILPETIEVGEEAVSGGLLNIKSNVKYNFLLEHLADSTFRFRANEEAAPRSRFQPVQALTGEPTRVKLQLTSQSAHEFVFKGGDAKVILHIMPFQIDFYLDDVLVIAVNSRGRFIFEHQRSKPVYEPPSENNEHNENNEENKPEKKEEIDGEWEEHFKEHLDSKPFGPMAVAMDFVFPSASHAYGIPLHADSFSLQSTLKKNPYRLYNLDVFEYELNEQMAIYGSVPVLMAHGVNSTVGIFWLNAAETWVDIKKENEESATVMESIANFVSGNTNRKTNTGVETFFMSENGIVDVFFMLGPGFYDVTRQYSRLTGAAPLPPYFALGYHQSRWNYNDQQDVHEVMEKFDEHDIPMDVMWLDIEHTDGKKYFTWDPVKFSAPQEMLNNLTNKGRKLVAIVDPHIKRDSGYFLHNDATAKGLYVKTKDGKDYDGWCWPGSSSYLDFLNPAAAEYYSSRYHLENYEGSTEALYIWNDMNEPSVFNGPEVTMPKDCVHHDGWEHRDIHNIYGFLQVMLTFEGLIHRSNNQKRPFILSRSHFAGTQRYAAIWTGDNIADWNHLKISIPMCLSSAVGGISFCGADVGGFFKNPDSQLFTRWYQAGAYLPFFRAHSHIDTRRREPWLMDDDSIKIVRDVIRERYALLPYLYSIFYEHERTGAPVIRPLLAEFMTEEPTFNIDYEFLLGESLLIRPVTEPDVSSVDVYFPGVHEIWYDKDTYEQIHHNGVLSVSVTLDKIPVYIRGGSIIPKKNRVRRSSIIAPNDPYSLIVALDINGTAVGLLFLDDAESYEYRRGNHAHMKFTFKNNQLLSNFVGNGRYRTKSWLEKVVILGIPNIFRKAIIRHKNGSQEEISVSYNVKQQALTLRKPDANIAEEWEISLH